MTNEIARQIYDMFAVKYQILLWIFRDREWFVTDVDSFIKREIEIIRYQPEIVDIGSLTDQWELEGTGGISCCWLPNRR